MTSIKDLCADLHDELEAVPFNQKMFRGEQTPAERKSYLAAWLPIMEFLDTKVPVPMRRTDRIRVDLGRVDTPFISCPMKMPLEYITHMKQDNEKHGNGFDGHLYLNYMGFMFGGQIMKKRYPETASLYEFDDIVHWREYVRRFYVHVTDEAYVEQVREGFRMHIDISKELGHWHDVE